MTDHKEKNRKKLINLIKIDPYEIKVQPMIVLKELYNETRDPIFLQEIEERKQLISEMTTKPKFQNIFNVKR